MSTVFKKQFTMSLPEGAEIFARKATGEDGEEVSITFARWKDRTGKRREGRITEGKDGSRRVRVEAATWTAKYRDGAGIVREVSTGCKDKGAALAFLGELDKRAEKVKGGILSAQECAIADHSRSPIGEHVADYVAWLADRGYVAEHVKDRDRSLTRIAAACGFARLSDINRAALERYLAARRRDGEGARTSNRHRAAWVAFCNWCVREARLSVNPVAGIAKAVESVDVRRERRALTVEEFRRLMAAAKDRALQDMMTVRRGKRAGEAFAALRPETRARLIALGEMRALFYWLLVGTGLRFSEARSIRCSQVVLDADTPHIVLRPGDTKNRKGGKIALHGELTAALALHMDQIRRSLNLGQRGAVSNMLKFGPVDDDPLLFNLPLKMTKVFDRDLAAAGIPKKDARGRTLDVHCLRHTFATWLAQSNVPLQTAQRLMRHSDPKLTANAYTHLGLLDMGAAVSSLPSLAVQKMDVAAVETGGSFLAPTLAPTSRILMQNGANSCKTGMGKQGGDRPLVYEQKALDFQGESNVFRGIEGAKEWRARRDSNARHPAPEAGALSN